MITEHEALVALNELRCNVIGTQNAGWSNVLYPLVAILNASGFELHEPSEQSMREHLSTYGGAGGYPGNVLHEVSVGFNERVVGAREHLVRMTRRYLDDPSEENRGYLENALSRAEEIKR